MDFLTIALTFLLAFTLHLISRSLAKRDSRLPPGPFRLPLIGNLHLLGDQPHQSLAKLAKKHGPIMSLKLGQITSVVVSSSGVAKEMIQNHDLAVSSRSIPNSVHAHDQHKYSVIWLPVGSRWRSLRKILNTNIFSVKRLDDNQHLRIKKVEELIAYCRKNSETGQAIDIGRAAFRTTLNLMSNTIFSEDVTDPFSDSAKEFKELMWRMMIEAGKPNLVDFFPFLTKIDPQGRRRRMTIHFGKILHLIRGLIDERLRSGISREAVSDVLDVLLGISLESPEEIDMRHIECLCLDLFVAGTETQSSTLEWAMAEMLSNPDKMIKTQAEMALVIGKGKVIRDVDVARLPYLRCVVKETLRMHPSAAVILRRTEERLEVCGYNIPKDSQVIFNPWAIGRDETVWKDASTFKPERFLESNMDVHGQGFEMIPFGTGRKICPGMPLAIRLAPVMLGSLLNCFDWKIENGIAPEALDMEEKFGFTVQKARPLRAVPIPL